MEATGVGLGLRLPALSFYAAFRASFRSMLTYYLRRRKPASFLILFYAAFTSQNVRLLTRHAVSTKVMSNFNDGFLLAAFRDTLAMRHTLRLISQQVALYVFAYFLDFVIRAY